LPPFELTDTSGRPFGNAALQGHPSLLFFGYSACPDICPATLAILRDVQRQNPLASLQLLFITVDPQRDTPVVLSPYLESFSRSILGLTGTPSALSSLMQGLAAAVERQPSAGRDYRLTHSATLYLLDTHGRLAAVYSPPLSSAKLSADLRTIARAAVL
jgi:protein SCO1/2